MLTLPTIQRQPFFSINHTRSTGLMSPTYYTRILYWLARSYDMIEGVPIDQLGLAMLLSSIEFRLRISRYEIAIRLRNRITLGT